MQASSYYTCIPCAYLLFHTINLPVVRAYPCFAQAISHIKRAYLHNYYSNTFARIHSLELLYIFSLYASVFYILAAMISCQKHVRINYALLCAAAALANLL